MISGGGSSEVLAKAAGGVTGTAAGEASAAAQLLPPLPRHANAFPFPLPPLLEDNGSSEARRAGRHGGEAPLGEAGERCDPVRTDDEERRPPPPFMIPPASAPSTMYAPLPTPLLVFWCELEAVALREVSPDRLSGAAAIAPTCRPLLLDGERGWGIAPAPTAPRGDGVSRSRCDPTGDIESTSLVECREVTKSVRTAVSGGDDTPP